MLNEPSVCIENMRFHLITFGVIGLFSAACVKLPQSQASRVPGSLQVPKRYDASKAPVMEVSSGLLSLFSDGKLRSYVNKALAQNPDLKASAASFEEAGFDLKSSRGALFPTLAGNFSARRANTQGFSNSSVSTFTNYNPTLDASWEIDVWGRIRAGVTAAAKDRAAAAADYAAARESIAAQTMQAYFNLLAAEKMLAVSKRRQASFQKTYDLVNRRFEAGVSDLGSADLAKTDLENARAQEAERQNSRDQAARSLAVLTGSYPSKKAAVGSWPSLKRNVRSGLPSDLLMKRPDIDAAYQRILAADSRVKVAHRDLYPSFSLTGSGGRESNILSDLADSNFSLWSIVGNISAPLYASGSLRSELGATNARAKQALANYQSIVLNAFREVEDALGSDRYLLNQQSATARALLASQSAEARIKRNYESGLVEILTLLDTQRRSFDTEESLIAIKSQRYQNRVALALALGKGL